MSEEENYRNSKQEKLFEVLKLLDISKINILPTDFSAKFSAQDLEQNWLNQIEFIWLPKDSRRRIALQIDQQHNLGFFAPKSHQLQVISSYDFAKKEISDLIAPLSKMVKKLENKLLMQAKITAFDNGLDLNLICKKNPKTHDLGKIFDFAKKYNLNCSYSFEQRVSPILILRKNLLKIGENWLEVESDIFLQASQSGLDSIISRLAMQISRQNFNPKKILDLYAGFGTYCFGLQALEAFAFAKFFAFEGSEKMIKIAQKNIDKHGLNGKITAKCRDIAANPLQPKEINEFDTVIINPPRIGAASQISEIAKSSLKCLHYVSCNPSSFVFDAKILLANGFVLKNLLAIDQFHSTLHFELVAYFSKNFKKSS